jgi:CelD/BcsL family acetyltransferase involved in cellulose biosynthesis
MRVPLVVEGEAGVAEIADIALVRRASVTTDAADIGPRQTASESGFLPLTAVPADAWSALAARAIEPNGYYLPEWELAVNASAAGRTGTSALCAWSDASPAAQLVGLMPAISMRRAYGIPLPALVSGHPYGTLCTPLIDRDRPEAAVASLIRAAREAGARALILRDVSLEGAAMAAVTDVLAHDGVRPRILQSHLRACLDATRDPDELLHDALGAKKLKELRRQRHRLADHGTIAVEVARSPGDVSAATEIFLALEASGWKGARHTALIQSEGDAAFIRRATKAMAATGQCEIVTLRAGATPVAAGVVLRHQARAFYFKIGVDERFAKFSPGAQLTLDLTKHLCADPAIRSADSTASPDHPMINPIWRGRFAIGDVLIPLRRNDPVVALIETTLRGRIFARDLARRSVHWLRHRNRH